MSDSPEQKPSPLKEITQPFIDLLHAPRALWGINLAYVIEGMVYFGMLTYLAVYFNHYIGLNDVWAGRMVGVLTAGITIAMFFLGTVADKKGVRFALIAAFVVMLAGRVLISAAPVVDPSNVRIEQSEAGRNDPVFLLTDAKPVASMTAETQVVSTEDEVGAPTPEGATVAPDEGKTLAPTETQPGGAGTQMTSATEASGGSSTTSKAEEAPSPGFGKTAHIIAMIGILFVVVGYGMYQPGAYAAVRQFTTPKTAAMGFAMLYALMNLGGWIPTAAFVLRNNEWSIGKWQFAGAGIGRLGTIWFYSACTALALLATWLILSRKTVAKAIADAKAERDAMEKKGGGDGGGSEQASTELAASAASSSDAKPFNLLDWFKNHPLANKKFAFFIFCLIPVQTLFAHNWLTLPMYVERAYTETWPWISKNFEPAVNFNPLLVFIFVPIVTALTQKAKVYNMMIIGTLVMAAPTFLLAIGPYWWTLLAFLVIMTVGEAMWQPRFLQYAAEIAPEGRTGEYMGVAQLPWFLTKMIVPLYSGWFLHKYCPEGGPETTRAMWLIYGGIAITSTIMLVMARNWIGKDFKTKHDG